MHLNVGQWQPLEYTGELPTAQAALARLAERMHALNQDTLTGQTQLMITPMYDLRVADALITNFHQPKSTLLLLIASFLGERWREVYDYALDNDYRFLSYGDSSLLFRHRSSIFKS